MPHIVRPDGARIYYEIRGSGVPLLLFAPGGISSQISFWASSPINPFDFADEFMVIGMDQRNAEHSPAPLAAPSWDDHVADQLAVLDAVGAERALLWGGCIGVAYVLRFIQEASRRVAAAVGQNPVGLYEGVNTRHTFFKMFEPTIAASAEGGMRAVVDAALRDALFVRNNAGGPFAARIAADPQFRDDVLACDPGEYARIIRAYDDQMWGAKGAFMSVAESFVPECPAPLLILPGTDEFHPTEIAERICADAPRATCLPSNWGKPEQVAATRERVLSFLREHRESAYA
jgi:pimeloyl-ACP methyl ester carboxylesterase